MLDLAAPDQNKVISLVYKHVIAPVYHMKLMLTTIALIANVFLFCSFTTMAQNKIMLTNYTYAPGQTTIGKVVVLNAKATEFKFKLTGENAKNFIIDKNNNLTVSKTFAAQNQQKWHDVVIEANAGNEIIQDTFRVVKDEFIRNQVIAHRGAWKNTGATENSIGALQHAIKLGCAGSEFDVHMSSDSVLFIHHDSDVQHIPIEKTSAAALTQLKLSNGENLPTLEAYLQEGIKQNKTRLILEIKPSVISKERSLALAEKVVQLVNQYKAQGWVDYISFDYDILKKVLALNPYAKVAYLNGDVAPVKLAQDKFYGFDYHFKVLQKNESWIKEAHQHKLTVNAWTVNDTALMDWLLERKADFITTNEPEILLQKVKQPK